MSTVFRTKLAEKRTLDGKTMTQLEWVVEGMIRRAISRSDRAGEKVLDQAERYERAAEQRLRISDTEVLSTWLTQQLSLSEREVADDLDRSSEHVPDNDTQSGNHAGGNDADQ